MVSRLKNKHQKSKAKAVKKKAKPKTKPRKTARAKKAAPGVKQCGLCGATENLTKTECCGQWICDDEDSYRLFSFARNSCARNHRRLTLCCHHFCEEHPGNWKDCEKCRKDFEHELEMYVYYGTNEYNFEVLENPPKYKPTKCDQCRAVIPLADGGYSYSGKDGYLCFKCSAAKFPDID